MLLWCMITWRVLLKLQRTRMELHKKERGKAGNKKKRKRGDPWEVIHEGSESQQLSTQPTRPEQDPETTYFPVTMSSFFLPLVGACCFLFSCFPHNHQWNERHGRGWSQGAREMGDRRAMEKRKRGGHDEGERKKRRKRKLRNLEPSLPSDTSISTIRSLLWGTLPRDDGD